MDAGDREDMLTKDRAKWLAAFDARHEVRKREEQNGFRWMIDHCVLLTLAVGGMLVKLAQDMN
ncbi:hypothetical protein [Burkholderia sp. SIMBA_062]|uniref:hypothetical protein n=1 Tax=Burkholderia sp. SIMBA_062 TaxID=3085803 RepID=UPI00397B4C71